MQYFLLLMRGFLDPELYGPYPSEKERDEECEIFIRGLGENTNTFVKLNISENESRAYLAVEPVWRKQ